MLNDFGEILDLNWRFFSVWLKKMFLICLVMSGFRVLSFQTFHSQKFLNQLSHEQTFDLFFIGFRFDLMICGFLLIPVLFLLLVRLSMAESFQNYRIVFFSTRYAAVFWCVASLIYSVNSHFLELYHRHMRSHDWRELSELSNLINFVKTDYDTQFFIFVFSHLGLAYLGFRILLSIEDFYVGKNSFLANFGRTPELILKLMLPLIIVALMARGSLGAHHLGARHSEISSHKYLNELVLTPLWTFNKQID